jgi:UDP-glucose 4-epimerase
MKSVVLGGNSFIGVHLVERLVEDGDKVRIYDRCPSRFSRLSCMGRE